MERWFVYLISVAVMVALGMQLVGMLRHPGETPFQRCVVVLVWCGCFCAWALGVAAALHLGIRLWSE